MRKVTNIQDFKVKKLNNNITEKEKELNTFLRMLEEVVWCSKELRNGEQLKP